MVNMILAAVWLAAGCLSATGEETAALASAEPLQIASVEASHATLPVYERLTLEVDLRATYANPFDSDQVRLNAKVTPQDGSTWTVPGFLYMPYSRRLEDGRELLEPAGPASWQVRLSFDKPGAYTVLLTASDASGTVTAEPLRVEAVDADKPGFARRHPRDHRYLVTDDGRPLYLVGANVCWGGADGSYSYDKWLPKYAENGCNFYRVWLSPSWVTFAMNTPGSGFDGIDLANAWRLDHVLGLSEELGLRVMLCIDSFNILRSQERTYGQWEASPYVNAEGGPLEAPREYFTHPEMLEAYRDRLRYLVARYGHSPNVFAWEFWNEVDIIDDYDSPAVARWHEDMARYLRGIDPWGHLVTTSCASPSGDPAVQGLPEMDFVQTHHYGVKDMASGLLLDRVSCAPAKDRPHFHGEYGIGHFAKERDIDPGGIYLHNGAYASVGQLQAGVPMSWWWDSYIEPCGLYPVYGAFSRWIEGFDFAAQEARPIEAEWVYEGETRRVEEDSVLSPEAASWSPAPYNQPMTVRVSRRGKLEMHVPLSRVLHGVRNHPGLHNPVTFELDAPRDTVFAVLVEGVSGHGGAALRIRVDGETRLDEVFEDSEPATDTMHQYDGRYAVAVPRGRHTVMVENPGNDWLFLAYEIPWLEGDGPMRALGVMGRTQSLVWAQNRRHTWRNACREDYEPEPVNGAELVLTSVPRGEWRVQQWDTVKGAVVEEETLEVVDDGRLTIALPPVSWDVAYRMVRAE